MIYIPGKVIDGSAIPWDGCVSESSNGVAGAEKTLPPDIIQTSHHTFGPQLHRWRDCDEEKLCLENAGH